MNAETGRAAFRDAIAAQREAERRAALFRALWRGYGPDGERLPT